MQAQTFYEDINAGATDLKETLGEISDVFGELGGNTEELDRRASELDKVTITLPDTPIYDLCGKNSADYTTNWTVILAFNSIVFLVLAVSSVLMCCACLIAPIGYLGICGNCLGCCAYLAAIIVTGVFRFGTEGEQCATWASSDKAKPLYINEDGDSINMSDDADMISGLFMASAVLYLFLGIITCTMQTVTSTVA